MKRMLENLDNEETSTFPELEFLVRCMEPIFAQGQGGLYIIDQHAAQERVKYEYYREKDWVRLTVVYNSSWFLSL